MDKTKTNMKEQSEIFKQDAKTIVDMCFNSKLFKDHITRDDMQGFEDFIGFLLQSRFDSHIKCSDFLRKIKEEQKPECIP